MELQPIETAPKDGTWVMLFGGRTRERFEDHEHLESTVTRPVIGAWNICPYDGEPGYWAVYFYDDQWEEYKAPTHWASIADIHSGAMHHRQYG
ncbi:hypothetical protein [Sphingomonas sp. SAFR-052]|uniref:hypothetical protein n=1 Tax=Sphingomonas sp. SAFR-052 TaxID=3436867 RepID=UPI003F7FA8A2